jgi:voltage-gated potassium channel Kch
MAKIKWRDRLRYRFDNTMAHGTAVLIVLLAGLALLVILMVAGIVAFMGIDPDERNFFELFWASLLQTLDAGDMVSSIGIGGIPFRAAFMVITLVGLLVVGTLIGLLTNEINNQCERMRKGRSLVVETGHIVILGWSPQVFTIVSELVTANENHRGAAIVILAPRDKVVMDDELRSRVPRTKSTRVVCRTGDPIDPTDLRIVNPAQARSVIILHSDQGDPDACVIKTILALKNLAGYDDSRFHIVAVIRDADNLKVAEAITEGRARLLLYDRITARMSAQICGQSGLSLVCTDLLDFAGDEIYIQSEPRLTGRTFAEALVSYEDSAVLGLRYAGGLKLNPPMDQVIAATDHIIAVSRDDDTVVLADQPGEVDEGAIDLSAVEVAEPAELLVLGWNHRAPILLQELDGYAAPGSLVTVITAERVKGDTRLPLRPVDGARIYATATLPNLELAFEQGNVAEWALLEALQVAGRYDHVVVLSESDAYGVQEADARTLMALLHLRQLASREPQAKRFTIVSEMLDVRNRELAQVAQADDYIVSDEILSLMLAQISENADLHQVFGDLLDAAGSELYLKPASLYIRLGQPTNFYTVVAAASHRQQVAIGYRLAAQAHDSQANFGIHLNPKKSERVGFGPHDRIIVLAES